MLSLTRTEDHLSNLYLKYLNVKPKMVRIFPIFVECSSVINIELEGAVLHDNIQTQTPH
jgi:hypothetical protein